MRLSAGSTHHSGHGGGLWCAGETQYCQPHLSLTWVIAQGLLLGGLCSFLERLGSGRALTARLSHLFARTGFDAGLFRRDVFIQAHRAICRL